jgi:glutathione S-transferase
MLSRHFDFGPRGAMKVYGSSMSRASRVTWCAKELGLTIETINIPFDKLKEPEFLAINPNGKVPAFEDGDLKLFESLAINLYLAKKYGTGELYPTTLEDEARVFQWTLWAACEVEHLVIPSALVKLGISKDVGAAQSGALRVRPALTVLNRELRGREWLVGNKFSVADINVASVIITGRFGGIDLSAYENITEWLERCVSRQRART